MAAKTVVAVTATGRIALKVVLIDSAWPKNVLNDTVKAGGMRITQHKSPKANEVKLNDEDINNPLKIPQTAEKAVSISGAPVRGNLDFPAEALQSFHQKPLPSHEPPHTNRPANIQQPRK